MYGPAGIQVHAGNWEHEALREANNHRRGHSDADFLKELEHQHQRSQLVHLVAAAATVVVALAVIVLI
jgi:hypothetical protein